MLLKIGNLKGVVKVLFPILINLVDIYCTFFHLNNYTIDFRYKTDGHPSFLKQQSRVNNASNDTSDANSSLDHGLDSFTSSLTGLYQEQYAQLVSLL